MNEKEISGNRNQESEKRGNAFPFQLPIGETFLDRYEIADFVGAGAFGVVYRVFDRQLQRQVALKLPRAEVMIDDELRERFANEVLLAAKLEHPGIVKLYEAQLQPPLCYFTSDYCAGNDLAQWAQSQKDKPTDWRSITNLIAKVAEALDYAHENGVCHRDIKPANILLAPDPSTEDTDPQSLDRFSPKLTDFGLAKFMDLSTTQNLSSFVAGTPLYMAPEQFLKQQQTEHLPAADIYSLGVILFELLAQQAPFPGENYWEILDAHRFAKPLKLSRINKDLPLQLQHICERCLVKDPAGRYSSAGQLASDLRAVSSGQEIKIRRNGLWPKLRWWAKKPARIRDAGWYIIITALVFSFWFFLVLAAAPWFVELSDQAIKSLWLELGGILFIRVPIYCWLGWQVLKFKRWAIWVALFTSIARTVAAVLMVGQPLYFKELYDEGVLPWVDHLFLLIQTLGQLGLVALAIYADLTIHRNKARTEPQPPSKTK